MYKFKFAIHICHRMTVLVYCTTALGIEKEEFLQLGNMHNYEKG